MPEEARFDVLTLQGLTRQGIGVQLNLSYREVVC